MRKFLLLALIATLASFSINAQEVEDTIKTRTRVVFLDALVKDKKTNLPISNLTTENFEVLDDGKPRDVSYFTREGQARKPLTLILILDLREDGAGRFLKRPEILKAMEDELAKLPPGDEVAIMAMDIAEDEERVWLTEFTSDRAQLAAALARVPAMCEPHDESPAAAVSTTAQKIQDSEGKPDEIVNTETVQGRNGSTVIRETRRDGSVNVKRTDKHGHVTVDLGGVYDRVAAVRDATRKAVELRPNSQTSIVW